LELDILAVVKYLWEDMLQDEKMSARLIVEKELNMKEAELFEVEIALEDNDRSYARRSAITYLRLNERGEHKKKET
jgi:hypothetical protein